MYGQQKIVRLKKEPNTKLLGYKNNKIPKCPIIKLYY